MCQIPKGSVQVQCALKGKTVRSTKGVHFPSTVHGHYLTKEALHGHHHNFAVDQTSPFLKKYNQWLQRVPDAVVVNTKEIHFLSDPVPQMCTCLLPFLATV